MKKSGIILFLAAIAISSCKNIEKQEENTIPKEVVQEQEPDILSTAWMEEIQLNQGKLWEANSETTEGVVKMEELLITQETSSIEDYHQLANKLNEVKTKVIKECTMKGASHDNLHIWLYPLIKKIDALSKAETIAEASKIKQSIEANVNAYPKYFQ